jgi:arsenite/tail-anchored protein-transporting ATPase
VRIILYTGKGGVGKTTLSAATALRSAELGHRTLVMSTDVAHSLADALGSDLGNEPQAVGTQPLWAAELDTGEELERYWGHVKRRIAEALVKQGVQAPVAGELAILPGLDEILALIRIKRYVEQGAYDALIIDSAPTGAAMRLLGAPDLERWYVRHLAGLSSGLARLLIPSVQKAIKLPLSEGLIQDQIRQLFDEIKHLREILTDAQATSVRLVLNPDHLSVQETQRAFTYMSLFGLAVDAIFVNRILPSEIQDPFFAHWKADQADHLERVAEAFAPLPVFQVSLMRREVVGIEALAELARGLYGAQDPIAPLSEEQPLRFFTEHGHHILALRLAGVESGAVELEKDGDELRVRLGRFRRTLMLPQVLAALEPAWAEVRGQELRVAFREPEAE